ncbi:hypothetical protein [Actinoplanes sp. NPDC051411]|uniref:hypothetical protein n=1 Tax=Actinoplanes sp. NPDC051411 TaxID=3155522 RepID=UPI00343DC101
MNMTRSEATLARLMAVNWKDDAAFDHRSARMRLMREFLRRSAWWAQQFGAPESWPFYDIAEQVAPGVLVPEDLTARLDELIRTQVGWPAVAVTCRAALHWAAVLDAGARPDGGEDPYEPLLLFFERGGLFTTESGFIEVFGGSVRRRTWPEYLDSKPADIRPAALAALDEADR